MTERPRILLTGAAGSVGRMIAPRLSQRVDLRAFDLDPGPLDAGTLGAGRIEMVRGSILDPTELAAALRGMDAVVHLAGIPREAAWADLLRVNIDGTQRVLEAARVAGVRRIVLASSNHAVGFTPLTVEPLAGELPARPDTLYGVSKAAAEALGSYYADRFGMDVVSIRIGTADRLPTTERSLTTWISPDDPASLILAALETPSPVNAVIWGMSPNSGSPFSLESGRALGWAPGDDAARVVAERGLSLGPASDADRRFVGGAFTELTTPGLTAPEQ